MALCYASTFYIMKEYNWEIETHGHGLLGFIIFILTAFIVIGGISAKLLEVASNRNARRIYFAKLSHSFLGYVMLILG